MAFYYCQNYRKFTVNTECISAALCVCISRVCHTRKSEIKTQKYVMFTSIFHVNNLLEHVPIDNA